MTNRKFKFDTENTNQRKVWLEEDTALLYELYCELPIPSCIVANAMQRTKKSVQAQACKMGWKKFPGSGNTPNSIYYREYVLRQNGSEWTGNDIKLAQLLNARRVDIGVICDALGRTSEDCVRRIIKRGTTKTKIQMGTDNLDLPMPVVDLGTIGVRARPFEPIIEHVDPLTPKGELVAALGLLNDVISKSEEDVHVFVDESGKVKASITTRVIL